jgi:hypothetical protein
MTKPNVSPNLSAVAREAKAIVALAFRNGPIEDVHAGKVCPTCDGNLEYSHITQEEMRSIMKSAVDHIYTYLLLKENDRASYDALLSFGEKHTRTWDEPSLTKDIRGISSSSPKPGASP